MAYLRLKAVTLGYTLPYDITKKALIQKARVYVSVDNPCLLYNGLKDYPMDPEITAAVQVCTVSQRMQVSIKTAIWVVQPLSLALTPSAFKLLSKLKSTSK